MRELINQTENNVIMVLIQGCQDGNRESQRLLYKHYYAYAMSVCIRYSQTPEEAQEIMNDGFMKVFEKINQYDPEKNFKGWLRRIMINTSIDHFRSNKKNYYHNDIEEVKKGSVETPVLSEMSYNEILELVQQLSPAYRTVFSLYVIDGYNHNAIAKKLGISIGASKSNLSKARANLKRMLGQTHKEIYEQYV